MPAQGAGWNCSELTKPADHVVYCCWLKIEVVSEPFWMGYVNGTYPLLLSRMVLNCPVPPTDRLAPCVFKYCAWAATDRADKVMRAERVRRRVGIIWKVSSK